MRIVNRDDTGAINTPHGSSLRPLVDRTTSDVTLCSLAEEVLPPGARVDPHFHRETEEIYYIVSGSGRMTVGEEEKNVKAGDAILIPRDAVHSLWNHSSEPVVILLVCGPAFKYEDHIAVDV